MSSFCLVVQVSACMFIEQGLAHSRFSWHTHLFVQAKQEERSRVVAQVSDCYEQTSQAGCLCEAEKSMKVSSTPTLIERGNERRTHVKADSEQGNGLVS
jgi:hypothetical protein